MSSIFVTSSAYDEDSAVLSLQLSDGSTYCVADQPARAWQINRHLQRLRDLTPAQLEWLRPYRLSPVSAEERKTLIVRLGQLRAELTNPGKGTPNGR